MQKQLPNWTAWIVVFMLVLFGCTERMAASSSELEWDQDIARQLVAEGWEHADRQESPMILYNVQVMELEHAMSRYLDIAFAAAIPHTDTSGWSVNSSPELLEFVMNNQLGITGRGSDNSSENMSFLHNYTWLGTIMEKPVSLSLSREDVSSRDGQPHFHLQLLPVRLSNPTQEIETQVVIDYLSTANNGARVDLTTQVGFSDSVPIAIINVTQTENSCAQRKYFVLFMQGLVLAPEDYPDDVPLLQVGSVSEMQELFNDLLSESETTSIQQMLNISLLTDGKSLGYTGQYTIALQEGLGGTAKIVGLPSVNKPQIYIGLSDELNWSEQLSIQVAIYLFKLDLVQASTETALNGGIELRYKVNKWGFKYSADYLEHTYQQGLTLDYELLSGMSLEVGIILNKEQNIYRSGITLR